TPPELAADIFDRGLMLVGGGALLTGLEQMLTDQLNIQCRTPNDPAACAAFGLARVADNLEQMRGTIAGL
ncbi:MAG TPA: rod shape-determining protein, partial [Clostridia bacterium]|nr:rod shape-determining protein [Clostridia bacterium]